MKCNWERVREFYLTVGDYLKTDSIICKRRELLFRSQKYNYNGYESMYNIFNGIHIKSPNWHLQIRLYYDQELVVNPYISIFTDVIDINQFRRFYNYLNRYFFNPEYYKLFLFVCWNEKKNKFPNELLPLLKDFLCI